ncbi:hypothetical protein MML48_9g00015695 [Holotrichia oblita]|uniref:Uncharacterized protein n=1 Tax=Holotrichia oblita TaxID=644536 RepID=A0ACB9SI01_HOLOL|nr:hypothetical protein MML48_9g00015695 [Holotrichia oblita]
MSRETFRFLHGLVANNLKKKENLRQSGRSTISTEKQLLLTLWTFATPDSYRSVGDRFNVGEATAIRAVRRVTLSILKLRNQFIKWPSDEEVPLINGDFEESANIPKVLGAIDGTHIKILVPKENGELYINRKSFHSIQLQVVCDNTRKFLHCFTGYPGSVNDQRVFKLSGMQELCNRVSFCHKNGGRKVFCLIERNI